MKQRLYRSTTEKVFGGVAGGIAEYFDVDPVLVRVVFVVLLLMKGIGLLAYIVLWIVVPERKVLPDFMNPQAADAAAIPDAPVDPADARSHSRRNSIAGMLLIGLGILFLAENFIPAFHLGQFWPVILIVIGIIILLPLGAAWRRKSTEELQ